MVNSGINKAATRVRQSFGEWSTDSEFSGSDQSIRQRSSSETGARQNAKPGAEQNEFTSRRVAAYWESRK